MRQPGQLRVLHLIASNFVGGPEKQILRHARRDSCAEMEVWIGSFHDGKGRPEILREGEQNGLQTIEFGSGRFVPASVFELTRTMREKRISLLCTHNYKANLIGLLASKLCSVPHVAFLRGWTAEDFRVRMYERLDRLALRYAQHVACVSGAQARQLARLRRGRSAPVVIPNAITLTTQPDPEVDRFALRRALAIPENAFVIGAMGRLSPEKGHRFLLDAAASAVGQVPNLYLAILGDGPECPSLEAQRHRLKLEQQVILPGFQRNVTDWMRVCDVIANPSLTEGMPNVLLEAISLGIPIIATQVGGVPEMIAHRESGVLVPPANPTALSEAIAELYLRPELRLKLATGAWKAAQRYSPKNQSEKLRELYADALGCVLSVGSQKEAKDHAVAPPRISVVIPVRNEENRIAVVLRAFREQDYPANLFEIVVADGMSTDRTADIVTQYASQPGPAVRLVQNPGQLSSCGRNAGVAAANGDIIFFSDGHCHVPSPTLLRDVADLLARTRAGILCRPQPLDFTGNTSFQQLVAVARASWLGHGRDSTIYSTEFEGWVDPSSAGAIYQHSLFEQFGGFDEAFDACEDVEFNHRLHRSGVKAYISPKLTIFYEPRKSLSALFRQMLRYGRGRVRLARKHSGSASLSQLVPASVVLLMMLGPALLFTPLWRAWSMVVGAYLAVVLAETARLLRQTGIRGLLLPPVFVAIHTGLGAGLIFEWATGNRRSQAQVPSFVRSHDRSTDSLEVPAGTSAPQEIGTT
jgi:succinoglycan biosynthesis protein ExoA